MGATEATGLTFVDEDDLPVAFLRVAHVDSDTKHPPMSIAATKKNLLMKVKKKALMVRSLRIVTTQI